MSKPMTVVKVVLSTGKVVFIRKLKIGDTEKAAQMCAARAGDSQHVLAILMQKALVQLLLLQVAASESEQPRDLTANEKEDLDSLLEVNEYAQLIQVVNKLAGNDEAGKQPQVTMIAGA